MPEYTVPINGPNGPGFMTVNASDAGAAIENASQGGNRAAGTPIEGGHRATTGGGGTATALPGVPQANDAATSQLGSQIDALLKAIADGNHEAFVEAVRQFDLSFGLDQNKFTEAIRQFNENLSIAQSGVTGQYGGQPTFPALTSYATQFGQWGVPQQGQQTLAAQNQAYTQQLGAITTAAGLQANPFRQAQVIGQLGPLLSGNPVAGFQAPGAAQGQTDFSGMGNMQRLIDDIRGGPNAVNSASTRGILDAIPTPTKLNSVEFARASPLTQQITLQGMQEKYGLSPEDALAQIRNTLPQFTAPTTFGQVRR